MRDFVATCRGEWPNTSIWPFVGKRRPSNILTVVDFPDPFGPSKPKTSPRRTSKLTLSTARALGRPQKSLKTLVRPRTATTTSPLRFAEPVVCGWVSVSRLMEVKRAASAAQDSIRPRDSEFQSLPDMDRALHRAGRGGRC